MYLLFSRLRDPPIGLNYLPFSGVTKHENVLAMNDRIEVANEIRRSGPDGVQ